MKRYRLKKDQVAIITMIPKESSPIKLIPCIYDLVAGEKCDETSYLVYTVSTNERKLRLWYDLETKTENYIRIYFEFKVNYKAEAEIDNRLVEYSGTLGTLKLYYTQIVPNYIPYDQYLIIEIDETKFDTLVVEGETTSGEKIKLEESEPPSVYNALISVANTISNAISGFGQIIYNTMDWFVQSFLSGLTILIEQIYSGIQYVYDKTLDFLENQGIPAKKLTKIPGKTLDIGVTVSPSLVAGYLSAKSWKKVKNKVKGIGKLLALGGVYAEYFLLRDMFSRFLHKVYSNYRLPVITPSKPVLAKDYNIVRTVDLSIARKYRRASPIKRYRYIDMYPVVRSAILEPNKPFREFDLRVTRTYKILVPVSKAKSVGLGIARSYQLLTPINVSGRNAELSVTRSYNIESPNPKFDITSAQLCVGSKCYDPGSSVNIIAGDTFTINYTVAEKNGVDGTVEMRVYRGTLRVASKQHTLPGRGSVSDSFSLTAPSTAGTYTYYLKAYNTKTGRIDDSVSWTLKVYSL